MMKTLLTAAREVFRPLAAKLFPEQFNERAEKEIVPVGTLSVVELKTRMVAAMTKQHPIERLEAHSSEGEVYHTLGYNKAVRDFEKLWEVPARG